MLAVAAPARADDAPPAEEDAPAEVATAPPSSEAPPTTEAPTTTEETTTTTAPPPDTTAPPTATTTAPDPATSTTAPGEPTDTTTPPDTPDPAATTTTLPPTTTTLLIDNGELGEEADAEHAPERLRDTGETRVITFPVVGGVSYGNDWGACRAECTRYHKGNDLIGSRLQPIVAMVDGRIHHLIDHPTAGYGIAVEDDAGWQYHVYHLNNDDPGTDNGGDGGAWRFAPGVTPGAQVRAGEVLGWMGDSGNSEYSVPHAHVEIHRPDGSAINPYWSLVRAERAAACVDNERLRAAPTPAVDKAIPASAFSLWVSVTAPQSLRTWGAGGAMDLRISPDGYVTSGGDVAIGGGHGGGCDGVGDAWRALAARPVHAPETPPPPPAAPAPPAPPAATPVAFVAPVAPTLVVRTDRTDQPT